MKRDNIGRFLLIMVVFFIMQGTSFAADRVVVIPLGGTVGNATASDVVKGKTFSSKAAGKGVVGTLKIRDGATLYTNTIGMDFSLIPAGTFVMGSPDGSGDTSHPPVQPAEQGRSRDEKQHQVTISKAFYMQTTEVTQGQWLAVMGTNPSYHDTCGMDCPVEKVSWYDAQNFIDALNAREGRSNCNTTPDTCYALPTEAQWEYADRAGTVTAFYNGDITQPLGNDPKLSDIGWHNENSGHITHPVAGKAPNNWGLYDMLGNVVEWCEDIYDSNYPDGPVTDPTGGTTGSDRVTRGGCWGNFPRDVRSAIRHGQAPGGGSNCVGFRVVLHTDQ